MRTIQIGDELYQQTFITAKDVGLKVPDDGRLYVQTLHDCQIFGRIVVATAPYAVPAICGDVRCVWYDPKFGENRAYTEYALSRAWQFYLRDLWRWSIDDLIPYGVWEGTYKNWSNPDITFDKYTVGSLLEFYDNMIQDARAFTDSRNVQGGYRDQVTGRNMSMPDYEWRTKSTTGNLLRVVRDLGIYYEVEALDLSKPPPPLASIIDKPWLLHWATETGKRSDGSFYVSRFPQHKVIARVHGWTESGVPIPNTSLGGTYQILKRRVKTMQPGQSYSPYIPVK
ncbi:MAG: hypothetical protein US52_C0042G0008 [candidate division WS6 bacterium GW2011_GWA2_37_6]|uniref:Uncharacterized protein n=1 Tax=candidate division WS6 bacterium GW2011_GWA2_37_6 TaxID=1619087 RepID=A0A0G0GXY5_9BACT|nr:MAG: hypothetical protein US52_C0042G0008 [candidate division WS6 bacterium GW2011_GWA2_37_6]